MLRSPKTPYGYRPSQSSIDGYSALNDLAMYPPDRRAPRQTMALEEDERDRRRQTSRRSATEPSSNRALSRSSSNGSLQSVIVDGKWEYRQDPDDALRLKSMGIRHLVAICRDIMTHTLESTSQIQSRSRERERKSLARGKSWPLIQLDRFQRMSNAERLSLRQAGVLELMSIVHEAASTSTSISHLVRIWREVTQLHTRHHASSLVEQPPISYETAFGHLIRSPNDQLLEIALHAAIIPSHNQRDLQRLGGKLGVHRDHFDMRQIGRSTKAFREFILFLREQKLREKKEQQRVRTDRVPFAPKKKRGLSANVSASKFPVGRYP